VINGDQQHLLLHRTGCDNITSFFEMRAIQTVGVVRGREWSHSEAVVFKICSLSLSAALEEWKACVCRRGLLFKLSFCDRNPSEIASMLGRGPNQKSIVTWVTTFRP
jgi:hypothetical protein